MSFADFRSKMSKFPETQNGFDSGKRSCSNLNQTRTKVTGGGTSKRNSASVGSTQVAQHPNKVGAIWTLLLAIVLAVSLSIPSTAFADDNSSSNDFFSDPIGTIASFLGVSTQSASSDDPDAYTVDGDTKDTMTLGANTSTRYDGRVWVDKSVSTDDVTFNGVNVTVENDSDFLVTYSALANSTQVEGESNVPVDVVFIIDNSSSMVNNRYLDDTVSAVNQSIAQLMNANPNNRVAVVLYDSDSVVLLPLGHYTPSNQSGSRGTYINYTSSGRYFYNTVNENGVSYNNPDSRRGQIVTDDCLDCGSSRGTNIQMGVYTGMNILASNTDTTVEINGTQVNRVPAVILLSDGAATYSSSSQTWWNPSNNNTQGPGGSSYYGNGMLAMATAQYMKQQITNTYADGNAESPYAAKVYTVGMGITSLSDDSRDLAYLTLDPSDPDNWDERQPWNRNTIARDMSNAWDTYSSGNSVRIEVNNNSSYNMSHPRSGDITTLNYNDGYYDAASASDVVGVFDDITEGILVSTPQVPTQVSGNDPVHDGYITYTDTTGQYMEVKDVKTLIWNDTVLQNPTKTETDDGAQYTFEGVIDNGAYEEEHNANEIVVTVKDNGDDHTQTITVQIPASAIPLRVNTVSLDSDGNVESNISNNAMPLRLCYTVGLEEGIDANTLADVSEDYISANTIDDKVNFYSNAYTAADKESGTAESIGAQVTFTPASTNPFYYFQEDTPIYTDQNGRNQATSFSDNETYYIPVTYYDGNREVTAYVARSGADLKEFIDSEHVDSGSWWGYDLYYIKAGSPRLGNLSDLTAAKDNNATGTALTYRQPTWDPTNEQFVVYLGNNGKLQLDAPSSLTIAKQVTAESGLTAPDKTFTFDVTIADKAEAEGVKAILHTADADDQEVTLKFNESGLAQVVGSDGTTSAIKLKANQSLEIPNMGNTDYTVVEQNASNNAGFNLMKVEGASAENNVTSATASGTVGTDDATVTFTNNYSVSSVTTEELNINLGGTKTITGRDFQPGDSFTFTIAAAQATPDAPLPQKDGANVTSATINPTSGDSANFTFDGEITFDKPGEYRYIITEVDPNDDGNDQTTGLGGVDYDSALYRINIVIIDNGDGKLRLAKTDEIADMTTQGNLTYTSNPMVQEYVNGEMVAAEEGVLFENVYSTDSATASIQGTKVLNVENSDYTLQDGDFLFTIEALGSNTDGGDTFTTDADQPMPVGTDGQQVTRVSNIANGNVTFSFAQGAFTQSMIGKTFGYKITESAGDVMSNVQFDSSTERIVKIAVTDDGAGHVVATVTPNDTQQGQQNNFTFTNSYTPTTVTIGDQTNAGIAVKKTFTGHEWSDAYNFDFKITASRNTAGINVNDMPMPSDTEITIGNPDSGTTNTAAFGEMTFEKAGTYTYTITETKGANNGITYDGHTATATVTVTEDAATGTLSARVSYDNSNALNDGDKAVGNAAAFTNTYSATFDEDTTVNLSGTKNLTVGGNSDRTLTQGSFFFVVAPQDGAPVGDVQLEPGKDTYTVGNQADDEAENGVFSGSIDNLLKNVTYRLSDLDGATSKDFVYLIYEQQFGSQAITYDNTVYQVTVTVTDDGNGTISASEPKIVKGILADGTFTADEDQTGVNGVVFNNSYTPVPTDALATYPLKKVLSGNRNPGLQANEFNFTIEVSEGDASGVTLPADTTISNAADGTVNFGNITFTKAGTYKIKVTEVVPEEATDNGDGTFTLDHVTYDTHAVESTFSVRDQNGKLVVERTGTTGSTIFTNAYKPDEVTTSDDTSVSTNILVTKKVTGAQATEAFTFSLNLAEGQSSDNVYEGSGDSKTAFDGVEVTTSGNIGDGATETKAFSGVTFTAAGDYKFVVDETTTTEAGGWTYDDSTHEITVHVADQNGQLVITEIDGNNPTFTNEYNHGTITLTGDTALKVQKTVVGAPTNTDFTFEATFDAKASAEADQPGNLSGIQGTTEGQSFTLNATVSDDFAEVDSAKTASFEDVTFTEPGTYIFNVKETNQTPAEGSGWTYDGTTKTITVTVTDNGKGALKAEVAYNNDVEGAADSDKTVENVAAFTNSYKADPVDIGGDSANTGIQVQKTLTGRDWQAGDNFTFTLTAKDNAPMPADAVEGSKSVTITNETAKTLDFGKITYDAEGTYTYTVKETIPTTEGALGGITYDSHEVTVTVTVTDTDHDGKLDVPTVSYNNGEVGKTEADKAVTSAAAFTNTYATVPGTTEEVDTEATFGLTKQLTGIDWGDREFTFSITPVGDTPMPVNAEGDEVTEVAVSAPADSDTASIDFGTFVYDEAGTYTYTVKEVVPEGATGGVYNGITYDTHEVTVTVNITDDLAGGFNQSVSITGEEAFVNNYHTELNYDAQGSLDVVKNLKGQAVAADQFAFTVQPVAASDGSTTAQEAANKAGFQSTDAMKFDWGTGPMGDDGSGHSTVDIVTGADTGSGHQGAVFTQEDVGKTYTYEFKEVIPESIPTGYTYDDTTYTVTITTEDDGNGNLTVTTTVTGDDGTSATYVFDNDADQEEPAIVPFNNSYSATGQLGGSAEVSLNATKVTDGRDMTAGEYNFTVTKTNGEGGSEQVTTGTNAAAFDGTAGTVTFDPITYTTDSLLQDVTDGYATYALDEEGHGTYTYNYTVAEVTDGLADEGITASTSSFQVTVVVTDNNNGTYGVAVTYPDGSGDTLAFANTYQTNEVPLAVSGAKVINANGWSDAPDLKDIAGQYTFTLSGVDEDGNSAPLPGGATGSVTANNDAAGNVSFGSITYTLENVFGTDETTEGEVTEDEAVANESTTEEGVEAETTNENEGIETYAGGERSKTFTYTIEESGSVDGIQNDSAKTFTVTVTDDGSGKLTVDTDQGTGALFTFTNTYNVPEESSSPTDGSLTLNKVLTGRDMAAGEFSFVMTGTNENAQGMSATGTNTAAADGEAGSVTLSAITFQKPGTYEFQISEVNNKLGGVGYDGATLKAVANVSSDGKGNMEIEWDIYNADGTGISDYTYNNTYTASPTSVILGGTKVLDGRTLADGEFNFELRDADGNVLQTVANNAEGGIVFDKITYDAEGTYEYAISEVAGDAEGITYDDTTYTAKVVVTDDGQGSFKVSQLTYNDGVEFPLFTNTYTEPPAGGDSDEGPIEYLTKTSDTWLPYFLGIIAAAAAAVVGVSLRKIQSAHAAPRGRHGR